MADESFPTINYVPIDKGGGGEGGSILEALMKLYGTYKGIQQDKNTDFYLAHHGPPGVNNRGDMAGADQVAKYANTMGDLDMRKAEGAARTSEAANAVTKTQNERDYDQGLLANDQTRTADQAATGLAGREMAGQAEEDKLEDRKTAMGDKETDYQREANAQLLKHYADKSQYGQLNPDDQAGYDAAVAQAHKLAGTGYSKAAEPGKSTGGPSDVAKASFGDGGTNTAAPTKETNLGHSITGIGKDIYNALDIFPVSSGVDNGESTPIGKLYNHLTAPYQDPNAVPQQPAQTNQQPADQAQLLQKAWQTSGHPAAGVAPPTPEQAQALLDYVGHIHKRITGGGLRQPEQSDQPDDWQNPGAIAARGGH